MADIVEYKGKGLRELIEPYSDMQKDYLCLRIKGLSTVEAIKLVKRKPLTLASWRQEAKGFAELEKYLIVNRDLYTKEVDDCFSSYLSAMVYGLLKLAIKVTTWDDAKAIDKPYIFKACEIVSKFRPIGAGDKAKSYDELVLRAHRER